MKRIFNLLAALALVVSMQGCGSGPATEPENPDSPTQSAVQLRLKGDIAAIKPSTHIDADGFEANDKVGVYVSATGSLAESGNMLDNEAFTYSSGNLTAPEGKEVYWGTPDVRLSVWAYYPYAESVSNNAAYPFAVAEDQSEPEGFYNSDFILAKATNLEPQTEAVNLTFNHSLSKISITLEAGTGITDEELAEAEKSFSINGLVTDGTIDLATGTATAGTTTAVVTPLASNGVNYAAIVYPQQGAVTFRMEMDDDIYTYTTDVDFEAALQYDYTLTIDAYNPQQMTLKTTTITPWGAGDIISFSDPKFEEYLLQEKIWESPYWSPTDELIDANNDGKISITEAERVEYIYAPLLGISDMSELHYFPNLKHLYCYGNQLTTLDVSNNTALSYLYCDSNQLTSLDVSNNTALSYLYCESNQLTSLDVSNNTALVYLHCESNQLTSLDVSKNTALVYLHCESNQLTSLDVSDNTALEELDCDNNQLTSLDVSNNTALKELSCRYNQLTSLDVSKNTALKELSCRYNQLTSLDVSKNTALVYLYCDSNQLTSLDVSNNTALVYLHCESNQLTALDVSKNTALEWLACRWNQLTSLDVSNNTALKWLECHSNQLTALDVSNNTALERLDCSGNQLTSLDVSDNTALKELDCGDNQLTSLDVSKNTTLKYLYCYDNQLTALDVSNNTALVWLACYNNQLTSLDVSKNTALDYLSCGSNQLTALDVSNNTALSYLYCDSNQLTSLDVSKNTALERLGCSGNQLTSLDVSDNTALEWLDCDPMDDENGNNLLTTLYMAEGQTIEYFYKPYQTTIEYKQN